MRTSSHHQISPPGHCNPPVITKYIMDAQSRFRVLVGCLMGTFGCRSAIRSELVLTMVVRTYAINPATHTCEIPSSPNISPAHFCDRSTLFWTYAGVGELCLGASWVVWRVSKWDTTVMRSIWGPGPRGDVWRDWLHWSVIIIWPEWETKTLFAPHAHHRFYARRHTVSRQPTFEEVKNREIIHKQEQQSSGSIDLRVHTSLQINQ